MRHPESLVIIKFQLNLTVWYKLHSLKASELFEIISNLVYNRSSNKWFKYYSDSFGLMDVGTTGRKLIFSYWTFVRQKSKKGVDISKYLECVCSSISESLSTCVIRNIVKE